MTTICSTIKLYVDCTAKYSSFEQSSEHKELRIVKNLLEILVYTGIRGVGKRVGEVKGTTVLRAIHLEPIQFNDLMHALLE